MILLIIVVLFGIINNNTDRGCSMKIESIRIQKFRSLDDVTLRFGQVLALVGANNAGKSHVLRALNSFFNYKDEASSFEHQDHAFSLKSRPKITVVFCDITESDQIPVEYINNNTLTIKFTFRWDRKTPTYEIIGTDAKTISTEQFLELTNCFHYIHIPIIRNSDSSFSSENGIAYHLLNSVLKQQIAKRNTLQPVVKSLYRKIENTVLKTAQHRIKSFYPFEKEADFNLHISDHDLIDTVIHDVTLELIENKQRNDIKNCGSGIQSAIYFAISLATSMDSGTSYLVGIEEPEQNMHPQAQRKLIDSLNNPQKYNNAQFVLTTHSTVIIDKLGHSSIALCRKCKGETRDIITAIKQIDESIWNKYQMEEERYTSFFDFKNSDFFFSDFIIITESSVDCKILSHLLEKEGINPTEKGISFIPADGEKSIKYPYSIVKELEIPFLCIVDRDVFQPYTTVDRKDSIDNRGLPTYKPEIKASSPIYDLLDAIDKPKVVDNFVSGKYEEVLNILDKYSIVSMRYAIEIDLVACPSYLPSFYDFLCIPQENRNPRFLTIHRSNVIKKLDVICYVLDQHNMRNLPASYKRIIKNIKKMII